MNNEFGVSYPHHSRWPHHSPVWRVPLRVASAAAAVAAIPRMPTLHVQVLVLVIVLVSSRIRQMLLLVLLQVKLAGKLPVLHSAERRH